MIEDKDNVFRAIKERLNSIGWDFFIKPYPIYNEKWHLEVLANEDEDEDNKRFFTVTIGSSDLSISFDEKKENHRKGNLGEILDFIEDCLLNRYDCRSRIE